MPEQNKARPNIFICYCKQDAGQADELYMKLKAAGANPWLDKRCLKLGDEWEHEIKNAVATADAMIVCLRLGFDEIGFRQKEVRWGIEALQLRPPGRGFIIPFITEPCDLPSWCAPFHAGSDLSQPTAIKDVITAIEKLCGVVLNEVERRKEQYIEGLIGNLVSDSRDVRKAAAIGLGELEGDAASAVSALMDALQDEDRWVALEAARSLGNIGLKAISALTDGLRHSESSVRALCASAFQATEEGCADNLLERSLSAETEEDRRIGEAAFRLLLSAALKEDGSDISDQSDEDVEDDEDGDFDSISDIFFPDLSSKARECFKYLGDLFRLAVPEVLDSMTSNERKERKNAFMLLAEVSSITLLYLADTELLDHTIRALNDDDEYVRAYAADSLSNMLDTYTITLVEYWRRAKRAETQEEAAYYEMILARFRHPRADDIVDTLMATLKDQSPHVRHFALSGLGDYLRYYPRETEARTKEVVAAVADLLADGDAETRECAVRTLERGQGVALAASTVAELRKLLEDPDLEVRMSVVWALGTIGEASKQAIPDLLKLLRGSDEELRRAAIEAFGQIGPGAEQAVDSLSQEIIKGGAVLEAIEAIGRIGPAAAKVAPFLTDLAQNSDDTYVLKVVVEALGGIQRLPKASLKLIATTLHHENEDVRCAAAKASSTISGPCSILLPHLLQALRDENDAVRCSAVEALRKHGRSSVHCMPILTAALEDVSEDVRRNACLAIADITSNSESVKPALDRALLDKSMHVRFGAFAALKQLGYSPDVPDDES